MNNPEPRTQQKVEKTREEELLERITVNPKRMTGKPTIRGMRISVGEIASWIALVPVEQTLEELEELDVDDRLVLCGS